MTCRDCADFLADYIDGALPDGVRQRFEAHLDECPDCVNYLQQYRDVIRLTAVVADRDTDCRPTPSPAMPEELVRAIVLAING